MTSRLQSGLFIVWECDSFHWKELVNFPKRYYFNGTWLTDQERPICDRFVLLLMSLRYLEPNWPSFLPTFFLFCANNYFNGTWLTDPERLICDRFVLLLMSLRYLEPNWPSFLPTFFLFCANICLVFMKTVLKSSNPRTLFSPCFL